MAKVKESNLVNSVVTLTFILQAIVLRLNGSSDPVTPVLLFMNRWSTLRGLRYIENLNITQHTTNFESLMSLLNPEIAFVINHTEAEDRVVLLKAFIQQNAIKEEV